jgi:hypothetical protein
MTCLPVGFKNPSVELVRKDSLLRVISPGGVVVKVDTFCIQSTSKICTHSFHYLSHSRVIVTITYALGQYLLQVRTRRSATACPRVLFASPALYPLSRPMVDWTLPIPGIAWRTWATWPRRQAGTILAVQRAKRRPSRTNAERGLVFAGLYQRAFRRYSPKNAEIG